MKMKYTLLAITAVVGLLYLTNQNKNDKPSLLMESGSTELEAPVSKTSLVVVDSENKSAELGRQMTETEKKGSAPHPEVLSDFKLIQSKVFKTQEEQTKLKNIIDNSAYLLELSIYLKNIESQKQENHQENQNLAVDLLLEALKSGDAQTAEQAIIDVIKDPQVENEKLNQDVRESLAGVKAELLYLSTSINSGLISQIEKVLPGPVSEKIWNNVKKKQSENALDSEVERQERLKRKTE